MLAPDKKSPVPEIIRSFIDSRQDDDTPPLSATLLFLLFILARRDAYASKVGCPAHVTRWIHFLLAEYEATRSLAGGSTPTILAPPDRGVRRRVTSAGDVELGPHNWPESTDQVFQRRRYDVCISFAGEQREFARVLATKLKERDLRVFFDEDERQALWGKDLFKHLFQVYSSDSEYCIILFSESYLERAWTNHELRAAQRRTLVDRSDYVLPVVFGGVSVPDEFQNVSYMTSDTLDLDALAESLYERIWAEIMQHWLSVEELAEVMNSEIVGEVIMRSVEDELRKLLKKDPSRCLGAAVIGTLLAFPFERVTAAVQGLLRYLVFGSEAVSALFDARNQFKFASRHARVMRFRASDGILLFPQTWTDRLAPEIKARMPHDAEGEE